MKICLKLLFSSFFLFLVFSFFATPSFAGSCSLSLVSGTTYKVVPAAPYSHSAGWGCTLPSTPWGMDLGTGTTNTFVLQVPNEVTITVGASQTIGFGSITVPVSTASGYTKGIIINSSTGTLQKGAFWTTDADGDGYWPSSTGSTIVSLTQPAGRTRNNLIAGTDCLDSDVDVYQTVANIVTDADNDGYPTSTTGASTCVGNTSVINTRTYYKNTGGLYDYMTTASILAAAGGGNISSWATTGQTQLPVQREWATTQVVTVSGTNYLYVVGGGGAGGTKTSTVYKAAIDTSGNVGAWATTTAFPTNTINSAVSNYVTIGSSTYFYLTSGVFGSGTCDGQSYKSTITTTGAGAWSSVGFIQATGIAFYAAKINASNSTYLWGVGGQCGGGIRSSVYKSTITAGTGAMGAWATTSQSQFPINVCFGGTATVAAGGTYYAYHIGGSNQTNSTTLSTTYRSTISTAGNLGAWSTTGQANTNVTNGGVSVAAPVINGTQYLFTLGGMSNVHCSTGGYAYGNTVSADRAIIDSSGNVTSWTAVANYPVNGWGVSGDAATVGGTTYMYGVGGYDAPGGTQVSSVYRGQITNPTQVDCNDANAAVYPGNGC